MPRKKPEDLNKPATNPKPVANKEPMKYEEQEYQAEVVSTSDSTTRKVKLDLEVDTSVKDMGPNPYARLIHLARAIDAWRIFPRMFLTVYIVLLYKVVIWFMALDAPSFEQSGLVSIVVGAGAAWFGLYTGSSKSKK
mgnify:FL=1|jgi:hypothetical protein|tara:strand:+ start:65 stop:475 length:411 start_codon:yes stop_codon:yes gene_type:complete